MPIYEYECKKCGMRFERVQRITDEPLTTCPECSGKVQRVLQPVGIIFKGSGFYCTDHRTTSPTALPGERASDKSEHKAEESKAEPKKDKAAA